MQQAQARKLERLGIDPVLIQKLQAHKIVSFKVSIAIPDFTNLQIHLAISHKKEILSKSEIELLHLLNIPLPEVRKLIFTVSQAARPTSETVWSLLKQKESRTFEYLPTSLGPLDDYLCGGIPPSSITEVVGPAGVGKSQLCHQLAVLATLPPERGGLGGAVAYFDTETSFSAERLVEIAKEKAPDFFSVEENLFHLATQVNVFSLTSSAEIIQKLKSLEEEIILKKIKLILIDSVASVVRKEFSTNRKDVITRQAYLSKEAAILKYLGETFKIPIVVINQVTTSFQLYQTQPYQNVDHVSAYITPALGTLWAHSVNTRLVMEYAGEGRKITIAKSPMAPVVSFAYQITPSGIELLPQTSGELSEGNFWDMKISGRMQAAPGMRAESQHHVSIAKQQGIFAYPSHIPPSVTPFFGDSFEKDL